MSQYGRKTGDKMNNEELNKIMAKADADLDALKDKCHELYEENEKLKHQLEVQEHLTEYLKLIRKDGEFDFEVSSKILNLSQEEYDELRAMLIVAIGAMEEMWRNEPVDVKTITNTVTKWK